MVPLEQWDSLAQKELKDQRVEVEFQVRLVPPDLQEEREREVHLECLGMQENQEKREILVPLDLEDEMDQRALGVILAHRVHRVQEDQGAHVVSEGPRELPVPQEQRELLVSLACPVTAETRALLDPRETEASKEVVDQWVYQESQVYQDFPDLVERRDLKVKLGLRVLLESLVAGVHQAKEAAQDPKENVADRVPRGQPETQEKLAGTVLRVRPVNQVRTAKTEQRVNQEHQDRKVPWDRRELQDPRE